MNYPTVIKLLLLITFSYSSAANSTMRIAVLNFELNDITSLPNTPAELARTASMAGLLQQALSGMPETIIVPVAKETQTAANPGPGYLYRFPDLAAKLGQQQGADWIVVAQHSKPSFLYSHLWVNLVNAKTGTLAHNIVIELKGNSQLVTQRAIKQLAQKITAITSHDSQL